MAQVQHRAILDDSLVRLKASLGVVDRPTNLWLGRQAAVQPFKSRIKGYTSQYPIHEVVQDPWSLQNDRLRTIGRDAYTTVPDQVTFIQNKIQQTLLWSAKSQFAITPLNIGAGNLKVTYYTNDDLPIPRATRSFSGGIGIKQAFTESTVELYGWDYDIELSRVEVDAGNAQSHLQLSPNIQQNNVNNIVRKAVYWREYDIFQGSEGPGYEADIGKNGICNWSGLTAPATLGRGSDSNIATLGDGPDAAAKIWVSLINAKMEGPFSLHMTPGVAACFANLFDTTGTRKSDLTVIREMVDHEGNGMFSDIKINPFLIPSETETTATGAMMGCKLLPEENYVAESYPLAVYPVVALGMTAFAAKIAYLGGTVLERPTAYSYASGLTTA